MDLVIKELNSIFEKKYYNSGIFVYYSINNELIQYIRTGLISWSYFMDPYDGIFGLCSTYISIKSHNTSNLISVDNKKEWYREYLKNTIKINDKIRYDYCISDYLNYVIKLDNPNEFIEADMKITIKELSKRFKDNLINDYFTTVKIEKDMNNKIKHLILLVSKRLKLNKYICINHIYTYLCI